MGMKLFEFSARLQCAVVIAAPDEETARKEIETWEHAWVETGVLQGVVDVELADVRPAPETEAEQEDVAHVVIPWSDAELLAKPEGGAS